MHIGDPARNFAALFHAGRLFTREVLRAYSWQRPEVRLDLLVDRASWWWEMREFQGLSSLDARDGVLIKDALAKLRVGSLFDSGVGFPSS